MRTWTLDMPVMSEVIVVGEATPIRPSVGSRQEVIPQSSRQS